MDGMDNWYDPAKFNIKVSRVRDAASRGAAEEDVLQLVVPHREELRDFVVMGDARVDPEEQEVRHPHEDDHSERAEQRRRKYRFLGLRRDGSSQAK